MPVSMGAFDAKGFSRILIETGTAFAKIVGPREDSDNRDRAIPHERVYFAYGSNLHPAL